ncbi:endonuclease NucS domain-containing protein [Bacillus thuringiensis]|uniref:endonuclease NucS domain-containing protein n=1 Tax=Bacillus thuringiensis TaxID=1428 RepID=UPI001EEF152D|nr:endonuclease NucS domain-containing protein [Bacillus thuringiensis]
MTSYFIAYTDMEDPALGEFTYGSSGMNADVLLRKVKKGDSLFFHTSIRQKRYITAHYVVEDILLVHEALKKTYIHKYKNPHLVTPVDTHNEVIAFGNPITSTVLRVPVPVTPELLAKLSKPANLNMRQPIQAAMASALRRWKELSEADVQFLIRLIQEQEEKGLLKGVVLSTEEVKQLDERDIEEFLYRNPSVLGSSYKIIKRQLVFKDRTRLDLLLQHSQTKEYVVVEIKKGRVGREVLKQIKGYMRWVLKEYKDQKVKGLIVCDGILPQYETELMKQKDVDIWFYGWQFHVYQT